MDLRDGFGLTARAQGDVYVANRNAAGNAGIFQVETIYSAGGSVLLESDGSIVDSLDSPFVKIKAAHDVILDAGGEIGETLDAGRRPGRRRGRRARDRHRLRRDRRPARPRGRLDRHRGDRAEPPRPARLLAPGRRVAACPGLDLRRPRGRRHPGRRRVRRLVRAGRLRDREPPAHRRLRALDLHLRGRRRCHRRAPQPAGHRQLLRGPPRRGQRLQPAGQHVHRRDRTATCASARSRPRATPPSSSPPPTAGSSTACRPARTRATRTASPVARAGCSPTATSARPTRR